MVSAPFKHSENIFRLVSTRLHGCELCAVICAALKSISLETDEVASRSGNALEEPMESQERGLV